jgi:hypothetical protein
LKTQPAVFSSVREANLGESVVAAGYPLQGLLARQVNITSGIVSANAGGQVIPGVSPGWN